MSNVLVGLAMVVGLVGVVVPLLPGTLLVLAAGVAWALLVVEHGTTRWVVVAVMGALFVAGFVAKYALPGQRLAGRLPRPTLIVGIVGAVVGFVVLPPLGLVVGGVVGVYLAEVLRVGFGAESGRSTVALLSAVGIGVLAELTAGLLMVAAWLVGVALT